MNPVIYVLDARGEAYNIMWYCSTRCRDTALRFFTPKFHRAGESSDAIEGTICELCCEPVKEAK